MYNMSTLNVVNENGLEFEVRVVATGDNYGLNDCLINDGKPLVEFWDMTTFEEGQFVSSYYVDTILEDDEEVSGLNLDGGVPEWYLDASAMNDVVNFLNGEK